MLQSIDEYKLKAVNDMLQQKLVKRGVPLKGLTYGAVESPLGGTAKQKITMQQGIPMEKAKDIVKLIKNSKNKVQASIQGDLVRVSGKDRDALQEVIALLKKAGFRNRHAVYELPFKLERSSHHGDAETWRNASLGKSI